MGNGSTPLSLPIIRLQRGFKFECIAHLIVLLEFISLVSDSRVIKPQCEVEQACKQKSVPRISEASSSGLDFENLRF